MNYFDKINFPISAITFKWLVCNLFGTVPTEVNKKYL